MSNYSSFMYSMTSDAILIEMGDVSKSSIYGDFSDKYPLKCPVCQFEIATRSLDPSRDKAIFIDGMQYINGHRKFEVIVDIE